MPLVMEPESRFYADPVIVLDFQSLYPSVVIAYNLCFCTCLGRPQHAAATAPIRLGVGEGYLPAGTLTGPLQPSRCSCIPCCHVCICLLQPNPCSSHSMWLPMHP